MSEEFFWVFHRLGKASLPHLSSSSIGPMSSFLLQEILGSTRPAEVEVLGKILMYVRDMDMETPREPTRLNKRLVIALTTDGYEASLCTTSWVSTFAPSKRLSKVLEFTSRYEYIDFMVREENSEIPTRLIIDMDFRSHFEVARPTPTYQEMTSSIPSVFVGIEEKLTQIVSLLCTAAKRSLRERRLHIPLWQKANYMQSKWFSKDCKKALVSADMDLG